MVLSLQPPHAGSWQLDTQNNDSAAHLMIPSSSIDKIAVTTFWYILAVFLF
jgi:hypothetical protein